MKCAIHQPNYLPWIGFFNKISTVECFVFFDSAQYSKNSGVINRTKIKGPNGPVFLTIPVEHRFVGHSIKTTELPQNKSWIKKHLRSIEMNYSNTRFFNDYFDSFKNVYLNTPKTLGELNIEFITFMLNILDIKLKIVRSSDLNLNEEYKRTDSLIEILEKVNATEYLSGQGGKSYLDEDKFKKIKLTYQYFNHPKYFQKYAAFEEGLSTLDLIFNEGPNAKHIIKEL